MKKSILIRSALTSAQIRWPRANSLERRKSREGVDSSVTTIRRAELTEGQTSLTAANDLAIRHALEAAGVEFIAENRRGAGVRLHEPESAKRS